MCHVVASIGFRYDVNSDFDFIDGVFVLSHSDTYIVHLNGHQPFFSSNWNEVVQQLRQRLNNPIELRPHVVNKKSVDDINDFRRRIEEIG